MADNNEESPAKRARWALSDAERTSSEIGHMRRTAHHNTAVFVGSGSGIHFVRSVYNAVSAEAGQVGSTAHSVENETVPGEDDQLNAMPTPVGTKCIWQCHEIVQAGDRSDRITFDELLALSQTYWDHWHAAFPFLHAPTVLGWFQKISQHDLRMIDEHLDSLKLAIVRAILSISLADRRQNVEPQSVRAIPACLVFPTFIASIASVQHVLVNPPTIDALQAAMAVQLFLISMLRQNAASRIGAMVICMVIQMGLHRCPLRYTTFTEEEIALRKRVLWTVYCMDRYLSQSLGRPMGIRDDDIDVCHFDEEIHSHCVDGRYDMDDRLALNNFLTRVFALKGMILELCNKSVNHRVESTDRAIVISSQITKLGNEIDDFLDAHVSDSPLINDLHMLALDVMKNECVIALNRPLLTMLKSKAEYKSGLQLCIGASRSIINSLHKHLQTDNLSRSRTPLLWPSFTWAIWQSAFILIYAAIERETPRIVALKLAHQSVDVLSHLSLRGSIWPNSCAAAIRDLCCRLEHSVTPHQMTNSDNSSRHKSSAAHDKISADNAGSTAPISSNVSTPLEPHAREVISKARRRSNHQSPVRAKSLPANANQDKVSTRPFHFPTKHKIRTPSTNPIPTTIVDAASQLDPTLPSSDKASILPPINTKFNYILPQNMADPMIFPDDGTSILATNMTDTNGNSNTASDGVNLFEGYDIPFWLGEDEWAACMDEWL